MTDLRVNIGCGTVVHPDWLNLDVEPVHPLAQYLDARAGIPLPDASAVACYSSHVIEHLTPDAAASFLREQFRILKPGGIIRVVCPDLEEICQSYLAEASKTHEESAPSFRHRHLIAELVDQLVRDRPGGELAAMWRSIPSGDADWVRARMGYVSNLCGSSQSCESTRALTRLARKLWQPRAWVAIARKARWWTLEALGYVIGGHETATAIRRAAFQSRGEVHLWMYDACTLCDELTLAGFVGGKRLPLGSSEISCWLDYGLEIRDGLPLKPNSLVIEAKKP